MIFKPGEKKRLLLSAVYLILFLGLFLGWYYTNDDILPRYLRQAMFVAAILCLILFARSLKRALPEAVRESIRRRFAAAVEFLSRYTSAAVSALRKLFGLPEKYYLHGRDESHFIYDAEEGSAAKRRKLSKKALKWKDLEENAERVRFLYIKYMLRLTKKGFPLRPADTTEDISTRLAAKEEEAAFLALYRDARYSGGRRLISDQEVDSAVKLTK